MADTFDKSSTLNIDGEILNRSSFKKTLDECLARRVGNESTSPLYVFQVPATSIYVPIVSYNTISSVANGSLTDLLSYTVPTGKTLALNRIEVSGENIAKFSVEINTNVKGIRRTYWGNFNSSFEFGGLSLTSGNLVKVKVIHTRASVADFDSTLIGALY